MSILTADEIRAMRAGPILSHARVFWAVVEAVCQEYDVPVKCVIATDRSTPAIVEARQFICLYARRRGISLPQIGRLMKRHHTSVLLSARQAEIKETDRINIAESREQTPERGELP